MRPIDNMLLAKYTDALKKDMKIRYCAYNRCWIAESRHRSLSCHANTLIMLNDAINNLALAIFEDMWYNDSEVYINKLIDQMIVDLGDV